MESKTALIEKIGLKAGLITSLALIGYFMLMKALGLEKIIELRFFNFIIIAIGISLGIRRLKRELHESDFYLQGWAEGMTIASVAVTAFALFMAFYVSYFDVELMKHVQQQMHMQTMNGGVVFVSIEMEGMASASAITLCAMQYFKSPGDAPSGKNYKDYKKVGERFH